MDIEICDVFETRRGKKCLNIENYKFREFRTLKSGDKNFRCTNKNCSVSAVVRLVNESYKILKITNTHTHDEYDDRTIHREVVRSNLKRRAEEDLHIKPNKLIRRELKNNEKSEHLRYSDMKLIRRSMYEKRKKSFPNIPRSLEDAKKQLVDDQHNITYKGNKFCFVSDDENIFIFTCKQNLELLQSAEHVFGDGTFSFAPKYFVQLYTIHVFTNNFYVPVAFCFLSNKHTDTYISMWKTLQNICIQITGNIINLSNFHVDFEKSAHNAVLQIFPKCKIMCCNFHLGQNWFRHIQQHKLLSSEYLNNDSEVGKWMKCFFGLSYLPPDEVSDGFCDLMSIAPSTTSNISIFSDYILENYITSDSNFPPTLWACEPTNNPKTTNGAESYHKQYNSQFYTAHPHIHQVIDVIIGIQSDTDLKINSINNKIINFKRKETINKEIQLENIWNEYKNNIINRLTYMKKIGLKCHHSKLV